MEKFLQITFGNRIESVTTFQHRRQRIDVSVPIQKSHFISSKPRKIIQHVPFHLTLIFTIVNGSDGFHALQETKFRAIFNHKRNQTGVIIVAMKNIGTNFHGSQPMQNTVLKSEKLLTFIPISIRIISVEKSGNFHQIQIETKRFTSFLHHLNLKSMVTLVNPTVENDFKTVVVHERFVVPRHNHACFYSIDFVEIFWQCSHYIGKSTDFCDRITFHGKVENFHRLLSYELQVS